MALQNLSATPTRRPLLIASWIISVLLGLGFLASGVMKFMGNATEMLTGLGVPEAAIPAIAVVEILGAVLILIPATRALGAAILAVTMVGAVLTHFVAGDFMGWPAAAVQGILAGLVAWWNRPAWAAARNAAATA